MKFELVFRDRDDSEKLVIIVMCQNIPVCELRLVSGDNIDIVFFFGDSLYKQSSYSYDLDELIAVLNDARKALLDRYCQ